MKKEEKPLSGGTRIRNVDQLNDALERGNQDFAIILNNGVYSRKEILRSGADYTVFHSINGRVQTLTTKELLTKTNIGEAMENNSFAVLEF